MMKKNTISLCMIVKDEETALPACLESVKDWVDEMILVDTGSTDATVKIATEDFGATVYSHPWEGDFSKHRNQSLSYASFDWVLIMDADEILREGDGPCLRECVAKCGRRDAFMFTVISYFNGGVSQASKTQIRLFRRTPEIFYRGIVHNQLSGFRSVGSTSVHVYHYGYNLTPGEREKKFQRTSRLIKKQIQEDPENYWHRHNMAVCYSSNYLFDQAITEGLRALALAERKDLRSHNLYWTMYIVASAGLKVGDIALSKRIALEGLCACRDLIDLHFVLVLVYHREKDWKELEHHASEYLRLRRTPGGSPDPALGAISHTIGERWRVEIALGDFHLHFNRLDQASHQFESAIGEAPVPRECHRMIADCYKNKGLYEGALEHYSAACASHPGFTEALLGAAYCQARLNRAGGAEAFYHKALESGGDVLEAHVQLGHLHYRAGAFEQAQGHYEKALRIKPDLFDVCIRLSRIGLLQGDADRCVALAGRVLCALGLSYPKTLQGLPDLAEVFLLIGHAMDKAGKKDLFVDAMSVAVGLNPELLQTPRVSQGASGT